MNYENVITMYNQRKNHKLDEWSIGFIYWCEYFKELFMEGENRMSEYELELVRKLDNYEELSESEIKYLLQETTEIETKYGDDGRWTRHVETVVLLNDKYYMIPWEQGLTEMQYGVFWEQPYEVEKHEYEKTITVTE